MTMKEYIKEMTEKEIRAYIRGLLTTEGERIRFDMSGYDGKKVGQCVVENTEVINTIAHLGIYDSVKYLAIDFYKGCGQIHLMYWGTSRPVEVDISAYGTIDILYTILKMTVLNPNKNVRRRN